MERVAGAQLVSLRARVVAAERERDEARAEINRLRHHLDVMWAEVIALAAAQEPPAYTPAPECPRCGLFLAPGEVHGEHEVGCVAQEPPAEDGAA